MDWPLFDARPTGILYGGQPPASGTNSVYGAWAELSSALPNDVCGMTAEIAPGNDFDTAGTLYAIDIGIGSVGNEVAVVSSLFALANGYTVYASSVPWFPVNIPKGTRLSMRGLYSGAGHNATIQVQPFSRGVRSNPLVTKWDALAFTYFLVDTVDQGWFEFVASTTHSYRWIMLMVDGLCEAGKDLYYYMDMGIGAGTPTTIYSTSLLVRPHGITTYRSFPCSIPAGTRISLQGRYQAGGAGLRGQYVCIYGGS